MRKLAWIERPRKWSCRAPADGAGSGMRRPSSRSKLPARVASSIRSASASKAIASIPQPMSPPTADGYTSRRVAITVPTQTSAARCTSGITATRNDVVRPPNPLDGLQSRRSPSASPARRPSARPHGLAVRSWAPPAEESAPVATATNESPGTRLRQIDCATIDRSFGDRSARLASVSAGETLALAGSVTSHQQLRWAAHWLNRFDRDVLQ